MKNVVLIGPSSFAASSKAPFEMLDNAGFEIINNPFGRKLTKKELLNLLPGVTGLIAGLETLDREVLESSQLKVISRCGAGMSNVDLVAAARLGINVFSTPDAPTNAVAELTVGMLISLIRLVPVMDASLHNNIWDKKIGLELRGKTVLLIGLGRIGRKVAQLLKPFQTRIIASDPFTVDQSIEIEVLPLEKSLPIADVISLHASGESEILGVREFSLMKNGVYILNAARGNLIDEESLLAGLESGKIAGAWLDSFKEEPYSGPLTQFKQVIVTPHIGSYTRECRKQMEVEAVNNLINALIEK